MLKLVMHVHYDDWSIQGLFDLPDTFDLQSEFKAFLQSKSIPERRPSPDYTTSEERSEYERRRDAYQDAVTAVYQELTGDDFCAMNVNDLVAPWLTSLGHSEIKFERISAIESDDE